VSSLSSGAGGGGIIKDGDPVSITLAGGESTTVPTGKRWFVSLAASSQPMINNESTGATGHYERRNIYKDGDTIKCNSNDRYVMIRGVEL